MSVIKNLAYINKNRLKTLKSFIEAEISVSAFPLFPFDILHSFLPFKCKFLTESFVSIKSKKIKGLISVNKTGAKKIKITRLLLEENSSEEGKLLVNYVTTLYLSKGAESFYVIVNKNDNLLLTMLKDGCNFKCRGKEYIYEVKAEEFNLGHEDMSFDFIKKMRFEDLKAVEELSENSINQYQKPSFHKTAKDYRALSSSMEQYIIENKKKNNIIAYFSILKLNKAEYMLDFMVENTYEAYLQDIITFTKTKLLKNSEFKTLFIKLKNYYSNFNSLKQTLDLDYKNSYENEILIKDYIVQAKQSYSYERMIFNDITPAF